MVDWSKGYSAKYYACRVDPATWRDVGVIELTGGTVKRESTGKRQSADVSCINHHVDVEEWVRVYMDVEQSGASAHVPLFTGLAVTPDDDLNGTLMSNTLTCYSVLKPVEDVMLQRGWYAGKRVNSADLLEQLLSASPAPVVVADGAPLLEETIIAEDGESNLSMVERILSAIGWRLRVEGDGTINVTPKAVESAVMFDPISNDCIEPLVKISQDWYSCPNVYMAVAGDVTGIAKDEDPDSPLSTVSRGREVWKRETGVTLAANESVEEYAERKLEEAQKALQKVSYTRRYIPDLYPGDLVYMHYAEQGLEGQYEIVSQSITLGYGAKTSENVTSA